jgi:hypothetical protein
MKHGDGPAYEPHVLNLSLGSHCLITFSRGSEALDIFLEAGGVLVFSGQAYSEFGHEISLERTDSVQLRWDEQAGRIERSSLANLHLTDVEEEWTRLLKEDRRGLLEVKGGEFNWLLEQERGFRASLTIRCKHDL